LAPIYAYVRLCFTIVDQRQGMVLGPLTFFNAGPSPLTLAVVIVLPTLQQTISFSATDTYISNIV